MDGSRRVFIAIATSNYDIPQFARLDCRSEVTIFRDWLCSDRLIERELTDAFPQLAFNPTRTDVHKVLTEELKQLTDSDALFIYITGHGDYVQGNNGGEHYLILEKTKADKYPTTAIRTAEIISWILEIDIDDVVILIDVCMAGAVAIAAQHLPPYPGTWLVLGATANSPARLGALANSTKEYVAAKRSADGPLLDRLDFVSEVGRLIHARSQSLTIPQSRLPDPGPSKCLPNPQYYETTGPFITYSTDSARAHWVQSDQGPVLRTSVLRAPEGQGHSDVVTTPDGVFAAQIEGDRILVAEANLHTLEVVNRPDPINVPDLRQGKLIALERSGSGGALLGLWTDDDGTWVLHLPPNRPATRLRRIANLAATAGILRTTMALLALPPDGLLNLVYPNESGVLDDLRLAAVAVGDSNLAVVTGNDRHGRRITYMQLDGTTPWVNVSNVRSIEVKPSTAKLVFRDEDFEEINPFDPDTMRGSGGERYAGWTQFGYRFSTNAGVGIGSAHCVDELPRETTI